MTNPQATLEESRNQRARSIALSAVEGRHIAPAGVVSYTSRGRVLVVGGEEAYWLAARVQEPLHAEVLLTTGAVEPGVPTTPLGGRRIAVSGHLGAFRLELGEPGHHNHEVLNADLLVDLGETALFDCEILPPGYTRSGREPADIDNALVALDGMVGTFEKPRYFAYDPSICAHSRAGQPGCTRCIDSCPADAIVSIGERIEVNPNLCQGGGICATACPTGAIRYAYPDPGETADHVRTLLRSYLDAGGTEPVVMFANAEDAADLPTTPPHVLLVPVEELASVGHEIWLASLAWGARCVVLVDGGTVPPKSHAALTHQVAICHALLAGMQLDSAALRYIDSARVTADCRACDGLPGPATFAASADKRELATLALDHLWLHGDARPQSFGLPDGAPYGRLHVDADRCTLCMGCTSVCPAKALSAGNETPRLDFFEGNCVQCGLCAAACPEQAITLEARYLADPEVRRRPQLLNEEPPFCCVQCGKPFATRKVIDNILGKLAGHAMFASDRARRRLQMCEDCRVVDAVQDDDAMQSGITLPPRNPASTSK